MYLKIEVINGQMIALCFKERVYIGLEDVQRLKLILTPASQRMVQQRIEKKISSIQAQLDILCTHYDQMCIFKCSEEAHMLQMIETKNYQQAHLVEACERQEQLIQTDQKRFQEGYSELVKYLQQQHEKEVIKIVSENNKKLDEAWSEFQALNVKCKTLQRKIEDSESEQNSLRGRILILQKELNEKDEMMKQSARTFTAQLEERNQYIRNIEEHHRKLSARSTELSIELNSLFNQLRLKTVDADSDQQEIMKLQSSLKCFESQVETLKEKVSKSENQLKIVSENNAEGMAKINCLDKKIKYLEREKACLEQKIVLLQAKIEELENPENIEENQRLLASIQNQRDLENYYAMKYKRGGERQSAGISIEATHPEFTRDEFPPLPPVKRNSKK